MGFFVSKSTICLFTTHCRWKTINLIRLRRRRNIIGFLPYIPVEHGNFLFPLNLSVLLIATMKFNIGNTVTVESFSLKNKQDGTILSDRLNLPNPQLNLLVIHAFQDYETGQRGWGLVKELAILDDPKENYPNYTELTKHSMPAVDAIKSIKRFFEENSSHLDEMERQEQLGIYQALVDWSTASAFKDNFVVFFSQFDIITLEP